MEPLRMAVDSGEENDFRFNNVAAAPVSSRNWACRFSTLTFTIGSCRQ